MFPGPLLAPPWALMSAAARDLALRAIAFAAAALTRWPGWETVAVLAVMSASWLGNSTAFSHSGARPVAAVCLGSLAAAAVLVAGWDSEPEELERWALRALLAALGSALPVMIDVQGAFS